MEKEEKIGFFNRIKIAIFKLEDYGMFLGEKFSKTFKYFCTLVLLISFIISLTNTYFFYNMINRAYDYIRDEMPDFQYENEILSVPNKVDAYDEEYKFRLYINTDENVNEEQIKQYKNNIYNTSNGIILLRDKMICIYENNEIEESYKNFFQTYNLNILNKTELIQNLEQIDIYSIIGIYFTMSLIIMFLTNIIIIFVDVCLIAIFGYIASFFCGVKFKISTMLALSVYSLTLSIILSGIYNVIYISTGFVIKYFNIMYLLIGYIYIIAAILMIKFDLIKQHAELQKIIEVQKQVEEKLKEDEENKTKEEDKKEDDEKKEEPTESEDIPEVDNREPDGSEI